MEAIPVGIVGIIPKVLKAMFEAIILKSKMKALAKEEE